jgi:RmuC family
MSVIAILAGLVVVAAAAVVWAGVSSTRRAIDAGLAGADAELRRLADAAARRDDGSAQVRHEIASFRATLEQLRVREEERRAREDQSWAVLHRVSSVLAGGQRTGRAGENVLRESLAHLPPSMVVTDFRVNGRVVEFGLVLPDGRRLPVDSKWSAERELQAVADAEDPGERERLVRAVERAVADRAREVAQYRDPAMTAPVGVAAVPDAAYAVLRRAHADAYRQGVIVVPYSMALPVLLFLYTIAGRFGTLGDVEACLSDLASALDAMEATLENRVTKAATMLSNGAEDLRGQIGKARTTLSRARADQPRASLEARFETPVIGLDGASGVAVDGEEARLIEIGR